MDNYYPKNKISRIASTLVPSLFPKLFFYIFFWSVGLGLTDSLSSETSIPHVIKSFTPALSLTILGLVSLYLYKGGKISDILTLSIIKADFSKSKIIFLFFALLSSAFVIPQIILHMATSGIGNVLTILISILGLIGILILSLIDPGIALCYFIGFLPFFLLIHIAFWELEVLSDDLGHMIINPEILLILSTFIITLFVLLENKKQSVRSKLDMYFIILIGISIVSSFLSYDVVFSFKMFFAGIIIPITCYYLIINNIRSCKELERFIFALIISFFLISGYSLLYVWRNFGWQNLIRGSPYRVDPFFANPDLYGPVLVLYIPLIISLTSIPAIPLRVKMFASLVSFMLSFSLLFTFNRGSWLGFLVSTVVLFLFNSRVRNLFFKFMPAFIIAFFFGKNYLLDLLWSRTYSLDFFMQSDSYQGRLAAWGSAIQMIRHNSITGVGPGMYQLFYKEYETGKFWLHFSDAENLFLNIGAEIGAVGMFIFASIFVVCLWQSFKIRILGKDPFCRMISLGLFAGLAGFIVTANTSGTLLAKYSFDQKYFFSGHSIYLFIFIGLIVIIEKLSIQCRPKNRDRSF